MANARAKEQFGSFPGSPKTNREARTMVDRFISEKQLEEERASGIPQRKPAPAPAKPLFEQLRENREKADEEFQEKIKFRMLNQ